MEYENKNIIFTVPNNRLIKKLIIIASICFIITLFFFTVVPPEFIVLSLPTGLGIIVCLIFIYGMRRKIIYRFTDSELQFRSIDNNIAEKHIKWDDIKNIFQEDDTIHIDMSDGTYTLTPLYNFKYEELEAAIKPHIK